MKVLLINYRYFVSGGPERYLFNLIGLLESRGHSTVPFSIRYDRNESTEYARYFTSPLSDESEVYFKDHAKRPAAVRKSLERAFYSPEVYRDLAKLVEDEQPDVALVLHYLRKLSPAVVKCLDDHRVPFAVRLSDFGMVCPNAHLLRDGAPCELCVGGSLLNSVRYRCVQGSLAASAVNYAATRFHQRAGYFDRIPRFLVPSTFTAQKMREDGWDAWRLVHLPTFVSPSDAPNTPQERQPIVVYIGRLEPTKGVHVLLDAAQRLAARGDAPAFQLRIVGDGDAGYTASLKNFVRDHDLVNVTFVGPLSFDGVRAELRDAACSVAPSLWYENMPNSVLESFAEGTPVVASDHGSLRELVDDRVTGRLFTPGNPDALADALAGLLGDEDAGAAMGHAGQQFVAQRHSPDRHYEILMDTFDQIRLERTSHPEESFAWT